MAGKSYFNNVGENGNIRQENGNISDENVSICYFLKISGCFGDRWMI
jgi:hypothetical protein